MSLKGRRQSLERRAESGWGSLGDSLATPARSRLRTERASNTSETVTETTPADCGSYGSPQRVANAAQRQHDQEDGCYTFAFQRELVLVSRSWPDAPNAICRSAHRFRVSQMKKHTCPIWNTPAALFPCNRDGSVIDSPRAGGRYFVSGTAKTILQNPEDHGELLQIRLTTWLVEQRGLGNDCPEILSGRIADARQRPASLAVDRACWGQL